MDYELEQQIINKYPKLFIDDNQNISVYEFSHRNGWYELLDCLCYDIQSYIDTHNIIQVKITQIKEKFGFLSVYYDGGDEDEYIYNLVEFARIISLSICEFCGTINNIGKTKGWILTICKDCFDKTDFKKWELNNTIIDINKYIDKSNTKLFNFLKNKLLII